MFENLKTRPAYRVKSTLHYNNLIEKELHLCKLTKVITKEQILNVEVLLNNNINLAKEIMNGFRKERLEKKDILLFLQTNLIDYNINDKEKTFYLISKINTDIMDELDHINKNSFYKFQLGLI